MKKIILIFLSIMPFLFSCSIKEISKTDSWKEKYGINPNTGVLAGKITLEKFWKDKEVIFFLTDKPHGKLIAYDTINSNGYILIKKLPEGRYYIGANDGLSLQKDNIPLGLLGFTTFSGHNCKSFYIDIEANVIKYIEEKAPGGRIDEMPLLSKEYSPKISFEYSDSCELKQIRKPLTKDNYINLYLLKMEN